MFISRSVVFVAAVCVAAFGFADNYALFASMNFTLPYPLGIVAGCGGVAASVAIAVREFARAAFELT